MLEKTVSCFSIFSVQNITEMSYKEAVQIWSHKSKINIMLEMWLNIEIVFFFKFFCYIVILFQGL